jgi:predicted enzyme related to lactoylglutathione lyase
MARKSANEKAGTPVLKGRDFHTSHLSKIPALAGRRLWTMSTVHGAVSFIELGVGNSAAGRVFYEGLFGWGFETGPSGNGWMLRTPNLEGGMHPNDAGGGPYLFFAVDDIDAAIARVVELGGEILPDMGSDESEDSVRRFGRFKFCKDDQGSQFGLHQPPA